MKKHITPIGIALLLAIAGCGTSEEEPVTLGQGSKVEQKDFEREIIAELKQTVSETPERDQELAEIKEQREFKDGIYGKPTDGLAENLTVQRVEGPIAIAALEQVYGGENGFSKEGVLFYGPDEDPGFWIGVKNPDERVDELVKILQEKVDKGEIKAEYIHIFKNGFTQEEQRTLTDQAHKEVKKLAEKFHIPGATSFGTSVDTLTGAIDIYHNFLTDEQMEQLRETFAEFNIVFTVQGHMAPKEGEPDVIYPENQYTNVPNSEGVFILSVEEEEFFTGSMYYAFTDAKKKLKAGQRVIVLDTGIIAASMPGQGTAVLVEILPDYKPDGADLSESEVAAIAVDKRSDFIKSIEYDQDKDQWIVSNSQDNIIIKDE